MAKKASKKAAKPSVADVRILRNYFRVMLDSGMSLDAAQKKLESSGWSATLVSQIGGEFADYTPRTKKQSHVGMIILFLVVSLAFTLYVLYTYLW